MKGFDGIPAPSAMSFELYKIPEGKIGIAHSDDKFSIGYLELNPGKELAKHNRPVLEQLMQIKGACKIILYHEEEIKTITLNEGGNLDIKPGQYHVHSNKDNTEISITLWKFNGDIRNIIDEIRKNAVRFKNIPKKRISYW